MACAPKLFWIGVPPPPPGRSAGVHCPPVMSLKRSQPREGSCGGMTLSTARHDPDASLTWKGSLLLRGLNHGGLVDSAGLHNKAPGRGQKGGPNHPVMGRRRSGGPERCGAVPSPKDPWLEATNPTQGARRYGLQKFILIEDLHEDSRVSDDLSRPALASLQEENCLLHTCLDCRRQPALTPKDTREAFWIGVHHCHSELDVLANALRRTSIAIQDPHVTPPAPGLVLGKGCRHHGHRTAGWRSLRHRPDPFPPPTRATAAQRPAQDPQNLR